MADLGAELQIPYAAEGAPLEVDIDGVTYKALRVNASDELLVAVGSLPLPAGAATSAKQDTMITALQLIDDLRAALGSVAGDTLRTEHRSSSAPAWVTQTDATKLLVSAWGLDGATARPVKVDASGRLFAVPPWLTYQLRRKNATYSSAQTNTELIAAPGSGVSLYVGAIVYSRAAAGTMKLVENAASPTTVFGPHNFGANDGMSAVFDPPLKITAATNLGITTTGGGNEAVDVVAYEI